MALAEMGFWPKWHWPKWLLAKLGIGPSGIGWNGIGRNGFGRSGNSPKILMLNFYSTYEFLSNFLCNWHELYYSHDSPTFFSYTFINRSIDIFLEFWRFCQSSEHRFPPCLHPELSIMCYDHSIVTYKFQYLWRVWNSPVRGIPKYSHYDIHSLLLYHSY